MDKCKQKSLLCLLVPCSQTVLQEELNTHHWPFRKSKFNLTASTLLHRLVLFSVCFINPMSRRYSTNCRTGKVDPARRFKCTTAARAVVLILFLFSAPTPSNFLTRRCALCSYKIKCMIHVNINPTLCSLFSHKYISSVQFKYNHAIWFKNSLTINLFMITFC